MTRWIAIFLLLVPLSGTGQEPAKPQAPPPPAKPISVDFKGFIGDQRTLSGPGWSICKVQGEDSRWIARLEAGGVVVQEFADCGEREEWMRFFVWPPPPKKGNPLDPTLLFVLRYSGGVSGRDQLDVVDLAQGRRVVFSADETFSFRRLEDLDGDGRPEIIGFSKGLRGILDVPEEQSPCPTLIISYDPVTKRYLCQNHRFPEEMSQAVSRFENAFNLHCPVNKKVPFKPEDERVHQLQFLPLLRWTVEVVYSGDPEGAWALLSEYATSEAGKAVREALEPRLTEDRYLQEMAQVQNRPAPTKNPPSQQ